MREFLTRSQPVKDTFCRPQFKLIGIKDTFIYYLYLPLFLALNLSSSSYLSSTLFQQRFKGTTPSLFQQTEIYLVFLTPCVLK